MLHELQDRMARSLLEDFKAPPPAGLVAGDPGRAAARFMIHRGNVVESLANALGHTYPAVKAICGERNFRVLAAAHVRATPPRRPQLMSYGGEFPAFVAGHAAAMRDFPFLADLARLEWAMNEVYYAGDAPALAPETLGAIPEERLPALRFTLHPAARHVVSEAYPIHTIWSAAANAAASPDPFIPTDLPQGGESVLVTRISGPVELHKLDAGETVFLGSAAAGAPLAKALAEAEAAAPGFDPAAALAAVLSRRVFGAEVSFDPSPIGGVIC
jgi:hypothetical protein